MGIPRFYRWLSERYPLINETSLAASQIPNFDALYLDMNGLFHNAIYVCNEQNRPVEDLYVEAFNLISYLVALIKPDALLYLAVDGVAPRAKMNQQRSRRFRSANDSREAKELKAKYTGVGIPLVTGSSSSTPPQPSSSSNYFDRNAITPGTEFMVNLSIHLDFYIQKKLQDGDPVWSRIQRIVFSGPEVPGEGEHKIMDYIRCCKSEMVTHQGSSSSSSSFIPPKSLYSSETSHCIYGLDADLIMLSLATHEPSFSLLRSEVNFSRNQTSDMSQKVLFSEEHYQLLHIGLVREYLDLEFREAVVKKMLSEGGRRALGDGGEGGTPLLDRVSSSLRPAEPALSLRTKHTDTDLKARLASEHYPYLPRKYDPERLIDDFILICILVGNDFLPHLPFFDITKGGLNTLFEHYKEYIAGALVASSESAAAEKDHTLLKGPSNDPYLIYNCGDISYGNLSKLLAACAKTETVTIHEEIKRTRGDYPLGKRRRVGPNIDETKQPSADLSKCKDVAGVRSKFYRVKLGFELFPSELAAAKEEESAGDGGTVTTTNIKSQTNKKKTPPSKPALPVPGGFYSQNFIDKLLEQHESEESSRRDERGLRRKLKYNVDVGGEIEDLLKDGVTSGVTSKKREKSDAVEAALVQEVESGSLGPLMLESDLLATDDLDALGSQLIGLGLGGDSDLDDEDDGGDGEGDSDLKSPSTVGIGEGDIKTMKEMGHGDIGDSGAGAGADKKGDAVAPSTDPDCIWDLAEAYLEGLQWVAYYYFRGADCCGWTWFYPYFHAPLALDMYRFICRAVETQMGPEGGSSPSNRNPALSNLERLKQKILIPLSQKTIDDLNSKQTTNPVAKTGSSSSNNNPYRLADSLPFGERILAFFRSEYTTISGPVTPFTQLMSVLPADSRNLVPEGLRHLFDPDSVVNVPGVTSTTPHSNPISYFYPRHFEIDLDGVKTPWGGITLIPFIDPPLLERVLNSAEVQNRLTEEERARDQRKGKTWIYRRKDIQDLEQLQNPIPEGAIQHVFLGMSKAVKELQGKLGEDHYLIKGIVSEAVDNEGGNSNLSSENPVPENPIYQNFVRFPAQPVTELESKLPRHYPSFTPSLVEKREFEHPIRPAILANGGTVTAVINVPNRGDLFRFDNRPLWSDWKKEKIKEKRVIDLIDVETTTTKEEESSDSKTKFSLVLPAVTGPNLTPLPGLPQSKPTNFPSLHSLPLKSSYKDGGIQVFDRAAFDDSVFVEVDASERWNVRVFPDPSDSNSTVSTVGGKLPFPYNLVGKIVYPDFPFTRLGYVQRVLKLDNQSDGNLVLEEEDKDVTKKQPKPVTPESHRDECGYVARFLDKHGQVGTRKPWKQVFLLETVNIFKNGKAEKPVHIVCDVREGDIQQINGGKKGKGKKGDKGKGKDKKDSGSMTTYNKVDRRVRLAEMVLEAPRSAKERVEIKEIDYHALIQSEKARECILTGGSAFDAEKILEQEGTNSDGLQITTTNTALSNRTNDSYLPSYVGLKSLSALFFHNERTDSLVFSDLNLQKAAAALSEPTAFTSFNKTNKFLKFEQLSGALSRDYLCLDPLSPTFGLRGQRSSTDAKMIEFELLSSGSSEGGCCKTFEENETEWKRRENLVQNSLSGLIVSPLNKNLLDPNLNPPAGPPEWKSIFECVKALPGLTIDIFLALVSSVKVKTWDDYVIEEIGLNFMFKEKAHKHAVGTSNEKILVIPGSIRIDPKSDLGAKKDLRYNANLVVEAIKEYYKTFPQVFMALAEKGRDLGKGTNSKGAGRDRKGGKGGSADLHIRDLFGSQEKLDLYEKVSPGTNSSNGHAAGEKDSGKEVSGRSDVSNISKDRQTFEMSKLARYINNLPHSKMPFVPLKHAALPPNTIKATLEPLKLDLETSNLLRTTLPLPFCPSTMLGLLSDVPKPRSPNFFIGQRVVYARFEDAALRMGTPATVVGLYYNLNYDSTSSTTSSSSSTVSRLELLLDANSVSGTDLSTRCSPGRGLSVHPDDVLVVQRVVQKSSELGIFESGEMKPEGGGGGLGGGRGASNFPSGGGSSSSYHNTGPQARSNSEGGPSANGGPGPGPDHSQNASSSNYEVNSSVLPNSTTLKAVAPPPSLNYSTYDPNNLEGASTQMPSYSSNSSAKYNFTYSAFSEKDYRATQSRNIGSANFDKLKGKSNRDDKGGGGYGGGYTSKGKSNFKGRNNNYSSNSSSSNYGSNYGRTYKGGNNYTNSKGGPNTNTNYNSFNNKGFSNNQKFSNGTNPSPVKLSTKALNCLGSAPAAAPESNISNSVTAAGNAMIVRNSSSCTSGTSRFSDSGKKTNSRFGDDKNQQATEYSRFSSFDNLNKNQTVRQPGPIISPSQEASTVRAKIPEVKESEDFKQHLALATKALDIKQHLALATKALEIQTQTLVTANVGDSLGAWHSLSNTTNASSGGATDEPPSASPSTCKTTPEKSEDVVVTPQDNITTNKKRIYSRFHNSWAGSRSGTTETWSKSKGKGKSAKGGGGKRSYNGRDVTSKGGGSVSFLIIAIFSS